MVLLGSIVAPRVALIWVLFYHKTLAFSHKKSNQKYPGACPSIRKYYSGFNWLIFWCGTGVARAWRRRSGGTEDTRVMPAWSLKKMVVLLNAPAMRQIDCGPKSEKIGTNWAWRAKKCAPICAWGFYVGINIILSIVVQTSSPTPQLTFIYMQQWAPVSLIGHCCRLPLM